MSTFLISNYFQLISFKSNLILLQNFIKKFVLKNNNYSIFLIAILVNFHPNSSFAENSIINYFNFNELQTCLRKSNFKECKKLIFIMEKLQVEASNKGNFKCQSTLLGIQTELIKNLYFEKNDILPRPIINSNLIKNC
tara:strand:+ start:117 stop:530 length:414 start_codon:yes stop_codon:yes gene_type:complete